MWRNKKVIGGVVLVVVLLFASLGGIALAADNGDDSQPKTLLARVAEILGIDQQTVEDAFAQARSEMRDEALDRYLQGLIDEGKITQEEADQYRAWLAAKPDMTAYQEQLKEWRQTKPGGISPQFKEWQEAKPGVPLPGYPGRFGGHGFGFGGGLKWGFGHYFGGR